MKKVLKIAFIVRSTLFKVVGGDNMQVINTANELKKLGVEVDIILAKDKVNYSKYDIIHLFNIIRPADHLYHIKKCNKPIVLSTIYLDYSEFDISGREGIQKMFFKLAGKDGSEYLKNSYRFLKKQDHLVSPEYILGHKRAVRKIVSKADLLLPNSNSEYERLAKDYDINKDFSVITNGINTDIFSRIPKVDRIDNQIICVGQIYGRKNQFRLIKAANILKVKVKIIGKSPPNHRKYYDLCRSISDSKVEFISVRPQEELLQYYAQSKVHALPSWFETTGLSSLEAGAMGCNLVVGNGGDTQEYFKEKASFCDANDVNSIYLALEKELNKPIDYSFREYIFENYTWKHTANQTLLAYKKVLGID